MDARDAIAGACSSRSAGQAPRFAPEPTPATRPRDVLGGKLATGFSTSLSPSAPGFLRCQAANTNGEIGISRYDLASESCFWVSKDASGFEGGLNLYAYCYGDSINLVDPTGYAPRPGGYDSGPEALQAALVDALTHSVNGNEWGGVLYGDGSGKFSYTLQEFNQSGGSFARHEGAGLIFHTHPAGGSFSPRDIKTSCEQKLPTLVINANQSDPGYGNGFLYVPPTNWPSNVKSPDEPERQRISITRSIELNKTAANPPNSWVLRVPR